MCRTTWPFRASPPVTTRTISAPVGCHHCAEAPCAWTRASRGCLFTDDEHVGVHPDMIGCRNCVPASPVRRGGNRNRKLLPEPEAASGTEAAAAPLRMTAKARARARAKKRTKSTVKRDPCSIAPAARRAAACPTKALRLIDAQSTERARQNKRKAAARASASFASMKLNADLRRGSRLMEKQMAVCPYCGAG